MRGRLLNFDENSGKGVISTEDGGRYTFSAEDWKQAGEAPRAGMEADFVAEGTLAKEIYRVHSAPTNEKNRIVAALLAFFLGSLGVHKFYYGATTAGIIMLVVSLLGLLALGIPTALISIVAFIEFIIYLLKSDEDFDRIYTKGKRSWF